MTLLLLLASSCCCHILRYIPPNVNSSSCLEENVYHGKETSMWLHDQRSLHLYGYQRYNPKTFEIPLKRYSLFYYITAWLLVTLCSFPLLFIFLINILWRWWWTPTANATFDKAVSLSLDKNEYSIIKDLLAQKDPTFSYSCMKHFLKAAGAP